MSWRGKEPASWGQEGAIKLFRTKKRRKAQRKVSSSGSKTTRGFHRNNFVTEPRKRKEAEGASLAKARETVRGPRFARTKESSVLSDFLLTTKSQERPVRISRKKTRFKKNC